MFKKFVFNLIKTRLIYLDFVKMLTIKKKRVILYGMERINAMDHKFVFNMDLMNNSL